MEFQAGLAAHQAIKVPVPGPAFMSGVLRVPRYARRVRAHRGTMTGTFQAYKKAFLHEALAEYALGVFSEQALHQRIEGYHLLLPTLLWISGARIMRV